jgi:hypothetical protein
MWWNHTGEQREIYTVVTPRPISTPWELLHPATPPQIECGPACSVAIVEEYETPPAGETVPVSLQPASAEATTPATGATASATGTTVAAACAGVPADRRGVSPFARREQIEQVVPITDEGQLIGARTVFRKGIGITADGMRKQIACEKARYSAAGPIADKPADPTLVEGAKVEVLDRGGRVEVSVTTPTPDQAQVVLARANGEKLTQTARR